MLLQGGQANELAWLAGSSHEQETTSRGLCASIMVRISCLQSSAGMYSASFASSLEVWQTLADIDCSSHCVPEQGIYLLWRIPGLDYDFTS